METKELTSVLDTQGHAANGFESTLKAADLNWDVAEDKVGGMDTGIVMLRKKLLYRGDNQQALGIVGDDYSPSDPKEFLKSQYEFAEFIKGEVSRAGFIAERSRAFAFINIGEIKIKRADAKVGDPLRAYIYSTDGWDGGTPRQSRLYIERLACKNGQTSRKLSAKLWVSHTKGREERYGERWKKFLGEIKSSVAAVTAEFKALAEARMTQEQMDEFLLKLIPGESTMSSNRRTNISALFAGGTGNTGSTRWDAYNAVTEFVTHQRSYRGNDATPVTVNRFLGVLETDTMASAALALLN